MNAWGGAMTHFVLVNRKRGGHLAANQWTRHVRRYSQGYTAVCGAQVADGLPEGPGFQGTVHNCKRCWAIMRIRTNVPYNGVQRQY
jgi:hypothetical protein